MTRRRLFSRIHARPSIRIIAHYEIAQAKCYKTAKYQTKHQRIGLFRILRIIWSASAWMNNCKHGFVANEVNNNNSNNFAA
jgi:hypothetical protein